MNKFHTVKENSDFYDAIHNGIYYKDNIYSIYIRIRIKYKLYV